MRSITPVLLFTAILAFAQIAHSDSKPKAETARDPRTAIEQANARFSQAVQQGDSKAIAGMYTADAILFPPDSEMIRGSEAIGQFWKQTIDGGVKGVTLETIDFGSSGDVVYEAGKVTLKIQSPGKEAMTAIAKYLVVWKVQSDGSWKLHRDIWNSLPPLK